MRTGPNNPDLDVLIHSHIARKPFGNAPWNRMSPMIMQDYEDYHRFNTRSFDPHNEGLGKTLWALVEQRIMPERQCQWCKHLYTFGMMGCINCGAYLHLSSDLGKATQVRKSQRISESMCRLTWCLTMSSEDLEKGYAWAGNNSCFAIRSYDFEEHQESRQESRAHVSHCGATAACRPILCIQLRGTRPYATVLGLHRQTRQCCRA